LVPVKGESFHIIPDANGNQSSHTTPKMCASPSIQRGDRLYEEDNEKHVGTLGTIMTSRLPGRDDLTYVALTAGHIIAGGQDVLYIRNRKDNSLVQLKVAPKSRRFNGRPLGRQGEDPSFHDECAYLIVDSNDIQYFDHCIPNLDVHYFSTRNLSLSQILDPVSIRRAGHFRTLAYGPGLVVYKNGGTTGLTLGHLVQVMESSPQGWYELPGAEDDTREWWEVSNEDDDEDDDEGESENEDDEDEDEEWLGLVKWADIPFSAPGDSGSLVFALESGVTVPLGIHVGSPGCYPGHSLFIGLEAFCYEAEREGWELNFTHR
jgi:hypothetical protein